NAEPVHLLVDSTGLKLSGAGEWLVEKHGTSRRRSWRKLHIGVDADTGRVVAAALTTNDVDDGSQVGPLLDQIDGPIASFTADGAYGVTTRKGFECTTSWTKHERAARWYVRCPLNGGRSGGGRRHVSDVPQADV